MPANKVIVVDGNNYIMRMFYSVDKSKEGWLEEIFNRFLAYREKHYDSRFIFTFDSCKSARRLELFPAYKAHRDLKPDELREVRKETIIYFSRVIRACGFGTLEGNGYEADDYIACLVSMLKTRNLVTILSTDQDMWQLVDTNVRVYDPTKSIFVDEDNFEYVVEIPKRLYLDLKCLIGDKSDNIPGIPRIKDTTAIKLIKEYGSLKEILDGINNKPSSERKCVEKNLLTKESVDRLNLNRKLMSLNIPINDTKLQEIIKHSIQNESKQNKEELHKILGERGLGNLYKSILRTCFV